MSAVDYMQQLARERDESAPRSRVVRKRSNSVELKSYETRARSFSEVPRGRAFSFHGCPEVILKLRESLLQDTGGIRDVEAKPKGARVTRPEEGHGRFFDDRKVPGPGIKKLLSSKKLDSSPNVSDNLSTMSTCTPPPSPGRMDFVQSPASRGSFRLPVLPEGTGGTPEVGLMDFRLGRSRSLSSMPVTRPAARGPFRDYNREHELWLQTVDKELQHEHCGSHVDRNWYDYMVKRYVTAPMGPQRQRAAPPPGPSGAALTDRGVRLREGEAARQTFGLRTFRDFWGEPQPEQERLDYTTEYEDVFVHSRNCTCIRCRPEDFHSAGLRSADCRREARGRSRSVDHGLHLCQPRCPEREEFELRRSMGRRTKFVDLRSDNQEEMGSGRAAGRFDPELHERSLLARQAAAAQHHAEHERGRCCQVALAVNPRSSDPPLPPPILSKKEGTFSGRCLHESLKHSVYHNQEIFRFDPQARKALSARRSRSSPPSLRGPGGDLGGRGFCDELSDESDEEYRERDYGYDEELRAGLRTAVLAKRGIHAWHNEAPVSPASSCRSARAERVNNSDMMAWSTNHDLADQQAINMRSWRMQAEKPFGDLCIQSARLHERATAERESIKSSQKGSAGMASVLSWG